jgi:6-phosphofructokinase
MIDLLLTDKRNNPSNYAMVVLSEGAEWEGYKVRSTASRTPTAIARRPTWPRTFSDEIKKRTKEETMVSDLTYELRSGEPDFLDKMIATTFGNMALDCLAENVPA